MSEERHFAFGQNKRCGCECPAMVAGFEPASDDNSLTPAELYDDYVRDFSDNNSFGVVKEEVAKEAWLNALNKIERFGYDGEEVAREVAKELGWL